MRKVTKTVTVTDASTDAPAPKVQSIRQICIGMIMNGADTKTIATQVQLLHPESAAAKKSAKHIAWYRAQLKKEGKLPVQLQA